MTFREMGIASPGSSGTEPRRCYRLCEPVDAAADDSERGWQRFQLPGGSGRWASPHHFLEPRGEPTGRGITGITGERPRALVLQWFLV